MKAFHGKEAVKKKYLARVRGHIKADELVRGLTGEGGKGCAVWCTLDKYNHAAYETELGIPEWLARVEDAIFENMNLARSKTWPLDFLKAAKPGANLDKIKAPFMITILESSLKNFDHEKHPEVKKSITDVIALWKKWPEGPTAWSAAWSAARSATFDYFADQLLILMRGLK